MKAKQLPSIKSALTLPLLCFWTTPGHW